MRVLQTDGILLSFSTCTATPNFCFSIELCERIKRTYRSEVWLHTTLSGVDEKPINQSPDAFTVSGLFVLLLVDRTRGNCRVQSSSLALSLVVVPLVLLHYGSGIFYVVLYPQSVM